MDDGGGQIAPSRGPLNATPAPSGRLRWLLGVFYLASAVAVLVAVASTFDRASGRVVPSVAAIGVALVALAAALRCLASAWASLLPGEAASVDLRRCVYASQPGKYVPGGVVQAVGQMAIAGRVGIPLRTSFPAYAVYTAQAALASLAAGALLVTQGSSVGVGWAVVAGGLGVVATLAVSRRALDLMVRVARRVVPRLRRMGPLPDQAAVARGFALQLGFALLQGAAFAVLLRSLDSDVPAVAAVGAHALAFGIGLLAVPVPSGLLVREAVLVAVLHSVAGPGTVVTAAVVQRLATITAEVAMLAANRLASRLAPRSASRPPSPPAALVTGGGSP